MSLTFPLIDPGVVHQFRIGLVRNVEELGQGRNGITVREPEAFLDSQVEVDCRRAPELVALGSRRPGGRNSVAIVINRIAGSGKIDAAGGAKNAAEMKTKWQLVYAGCHKNVRNEQIGVATVKLKVVIVRGNTAAALLPYTQAEVRVQQVVSTFRIGVIYLTLKTSGEALVESQDKGIVLAVIPWSVAALNRPPRRL